ncbi:hypothetical protein QA020_gp01 [Salmonella phage horsemountain]|uniref:Uncharacterized protein n=1 Tax=Salmonella phage horsemountain TaxID=2713302 RepID=A0A6G8RQK4_9CAUD|nr:hypothetical protein QA020_gp01 [Salmonella phage horsemountain]QIO03669.1 hypothetical protein horsemountain_1 [Salmonella phage horsemountain]
MAGVLVVAGSHPDTDDDGWIIPGVSWWRGRTWVLLPEPQEACNSSLGFY